MTVPPSSPDIVHWTDRRFRDCSWPESAKWAVFYFVGWGIVFPAMLIAGLMVLGMMVDGVGRYNEEHDRCLRHATNGYEIKQCQ